MAFVEIHLTVGVVEAVTVKEHVGTVGVVEDKFEVLRPAIHASDIKVKHLVVVDGIETQFSLAVLIRIGQGNKFLAFEQAAFEIVCAVASPSGNGDRDSVRAYGQGGGALDFGRERLVEPST